MKPLVYKSGSRLVAGPTQMYVSACQILPATHMCAQNDTTTQPVWGDLSSTPAKRKKFIVALVKFMTSFGFDGVDLDW